METHRSGLGSRTVSSALCRAFLGIVEGGRWMVQRWRWAGGRRRVLLDGRLEWMVWDGSGFGGWGSDDGVSSGRRRWR